MKTPAERRRDDLKALMRQQGFLNLMGWILREAHILEPSRSADGGASLWSEGRRSLGLELFRELKAADARAFAEILLEQTRSPREADHDPDD